MMEQDIREGRTSLGIELGSTRIKAVLVNREGKPLASGSHEWENQLVDGVWTYSLEAVWDGLRACYADLRQNVKETYGVALQTVGQMGVSAMMHGYLAFDRDGKLLVPFRTWRNTMTEQASTELTDLFGFNIPQRWTVAHLYQAVLNGEAHIPLLSHLTTLAGYVHWQLTGQKVVGTGEAAGIFPLDNGRYDPQRLKKLEALLAPFEVPWRAEELFPGILPAGECAGRLTEQGARHLDPTGALKPGIPFCPAEGDAGTGMVATNSVLPRTGNVSAGTSVFAMVVLEKPLRKVYPEIDMVTTPAGDPVAMVHCNNCTTDLNAWVHLFGEFAQRMGLRPSQAELYGLLYRAALEGDDDAGGLLSYNFHSGEHIVGLTQGRPLFTRTPESTLSLANFMRAHLFGALGVLKHGMDLLLKQEKVGLDMIFGHGGLFKTPGVGQRILAAAINTPVSVLETAGEGGAWGMALLAEYARSRTPGESLADFLSQRVFNGASGDCMQPDAADVKGFEAYCERFMRALPVEREAIRWLN